MSAHYTPYKNEPDADQLNWSEADGGSAVQLYDRSTRRVVTSSRALILGAVGCAIVGLLAGLVVGYFAHREQAAHSRCGREEISEELPLLPALENETIFHRIREEIKAENMRNILRTFSRRPHMAGTEADLEQAQEIEALWRSYGLDRVELKGYKVLLSYPDVERPNSVIVLNDHGGVEFRSRAWESESTDFGPAFNAYSPAGTPQGELVYANYGQPGEFAFLTDKLKLNLTGKVIIMRLGMMHIGEQVRNAELHGAIGVILYPDLHDFQEPGGSNTVYPRSGGLPGFGVQRGTVAMPPEGDPLTPDYPAKDYAFRIPISEAIGLPKIPVHTLSYNDAARLLSLLRGPTAPNAWQGSLNITYNVGPGFLKPNWTVRLEINNSNRLVPTYNVIGFIRGSEEPDRYVLLGNHRDAWVYGAVDPTSGTAVLLELSRVFGKLLKEGWRPRRTIVFCSWGAEEFNLIGSTEWVEENMRVLQERAVAYLNVDIAVTGNHSLGVAASPLLYRAIFNVTKKIANPNPDEVKSGRKSVYDSWFRAFPTLRNATSLFYQALSLRDDYHQMAQRALRSTAVKEVMQRERPRVRQLHSGSDYAAFFIRAGIPSLDVCYQHKTVGMYPLYHTAFDTFHLVQTFIDPQFLYHVTVAQILGELLRDLADSLLIPFNALDYAQVLRDLTQTLLLNLEVNPQFRKDLNDHNIRLALLDSAVLNFTNNAIDLHIREEKLTRKQILKVRQLNDQLMLLERAFLRPEGLPGRALDRHMILSPSRGHTFGDETFPGITDLLTDPRSVTSTKSHWNTFQKHFTILVHTIQTAADTMAEFV